MVEPSYLAECLSYDARTGLILWRELRANLGQDKPPLDLDKPLMVETKPDWVVMLKSRHPGGFLADIDEIPEFEPFLSDGSSFYYSSLRIINRPDPEPVDPVKELERHLVDAHIDAAPRLAVHLSGLGYRKVPHS